MEKPGIDEVSIMFVFICQFTISSVLTNQTYFRDFTVNQLLDIFNDMEKTLHSSAEARTLFCQISKAFEEGMAQRAIIQNNTIWY